jgi:hypothetical protein
MSEPFRGSCFCGAVRFELDPPTFFCGHCHCTMCRRAHGAGYVTWVVLPREQFRITAGADRLARYPSSDHGTRSFCTTCGSSLLCESTHHPERIDVVLANIAGEIDRPPEAHVFFSDRVSWVEVHDALPKLGGATGLEPLED